MAAQGGEGYLARPAPSGLADVIDLILDKGVVVDAYARVSLLGIELLTIDARVVVSSVDTYLRFAEATLRLDLFEQGAPSPVDVLTEGVGALVENVASSVVEDKVEGALDSVEDALGGPVRELTRTAGEKAVEVAEEVVAKVSDDADGYEE